MKKDVIYIDVDDDITTITDKVQTSPAEIVALVLPKHCLVLQSSVNMKILNKTARDAKKRAVLITSESSLLPIAGAVNMYVAKTLQSKPYIPKAQVADETATDLEVKEEIGPIDTSKPIGELALAAGGVLKVAGDDQPIELGDDAVDEKPSSDKKKKKDKKLRVPNFERFRLWLVLVILAVILLISGGVYAAKALPRAKVTITTQNKPVTVSMTITGSPAAKSVDLATKVAPAEVKTMEQTLTKKFQATGQKDIGEKATGEVVFYNCNIDDKLGDVDRKVPAGTGISASGLTFITQSEVTVQPSNIIFGICQKNKASAAVKVVAQYGGDKYNVSPRSYSVAGFSSMSARDDDGMGGGTTKMVTAVSQADCDNAKNELLNTKTDDYKNQLAAQLSTAGLLPIRDTFVATPGEFSCSPGVGQESTESTATLVMKFSMTGVNMAALDQLVKAEASKQIKGQQSIFDTGVKNGLVSVNEKKSSGDVVFGFQTDTQTGIKQDSEAVAKLIAGKKYGESLSTLKSQAGVTDVVINYSPFWVTSTPKELKRISVTFVDK